MLYELSASVFPQTNRISYKIERSATFLEGSSDNDSDSNPAAAPSQSSEKPIAIRSTSSLLLSLSPLERGRARVSASPAVSTIGPEKPEELTQRALFPVSPLAVENCATLWNEVSLYFEPLSRAHIALMIGSDLRLAALSDASHAADESAVDRLLSCLVPTAEFAGAPALGAEGEAERRAAVREEEEEERSRRAARKVEPFVEEELAKLGLDCDEEEEEEMENEEEEEEEEEMEKEMEEKQQEMEEEKQEMEEEKEKEIKSPTENENISDSESDEEVKKRRRNAECARLWKEIAKLKEERKTLFGAIKEKCFEEIRAEKREKEKALKDRWVMQRWEESSKRIRLNSSRVCRNKQSYSFLTTGSSCEPSNK